MQIGNPRWLPWQPSWKSIFASSEPKSQLTPNLVRSIGVTCRSKIAKIVPIGNPRWLPWLPSWKAAILKIYFSLLLNRKAKLARKHWGDCRSKIAKIVPIGNPRWPPWQHLENLFFASFPEPKGQLTSNLLGSIGVTCRSKIAKIMPIWNPRWPPLQPSWKSIFRFFSWTQKPIDSKPGRKHWGDL